MKVGCILLSCLRPLNMPLIVEGIEKQSFIDKLIIIHNHPSKPSEHVGKKYNSHFHIVSDVNLGCIIRHHVASLLSYYDHIVFIDDDLYLNKDLSDRIIPHIESHGDSVLGFFGQDIGEDPEKPYTSGKIRLCRGGDNAEPDPVDIVKGRFHIMSKESTRVLSGSGFATPALMSEDDIRANLAIQKANGKPSYLIPYCQGDTVNLPEPDALWHREKHFDLRNRAVRDAIELGWKSCRSEK